MENLELDTVVWYGGEVKALDDEGKVGGYLVRFSTASDPDLAGDYFTKDTDFGFATKSTVLYHHGMDKTIKSRDLAVGELKIDDVGVWIEGQLKMRDEYEKAIFEMAKAGKLGWSSGTASHLVSRKSVGSATEILSWPLGLDASLTPTPCEPRTQAIPLKSLNIEGISLEVPTNAELESSETENAEVDSLSTDIPVVEESNAEPTASANDATTAEQQMENTTPQADDQVQETPAIEVEKPAETKSQEPSRIIVPTQNVTIPLDQYNALIQQEAKAYSQEPKRIVKASHDISTANVNLKTGLGDSEQKSIAHWIKTGDWGAVSHMKATNATGQQVLSIKASNDTDMNVGTAADGGNAVPTGHFQNIVARRDEMMLANRLGVQNIPGVGTTVNVPVDAEDDGEFVSTAEAAANDRDAPALGTVAMTLAKYTKRVEFSDELLQDEDSRLMSFIENFISRGMAKTHNDLLITEVETNGTSLKSFAGTAAIAAGEIQDITFNDNLAYYLDDSASVAWVTRPATYGEIISIQGNEFIYDTNPQGSSVATNGAKGILAQYPVHFSNKVETLAIGNKSILFGNWFYVGVRNAPEFQVLRDPYSAATTGQLRLHYYFRTVYKVLQAEAIGYGEQA